MATATQIPVEEYLFTSYDPDREYVDVLRAGAIEVPLSAIFD